MDKIERLEKIKREIVESIKQEHLSKTKTFPTLLGIKWDNLPNVIRLSNEL